MDKIIWIFRCFVNFFMRPRGMSFALAQRIDLPRKIYNQNKIFIGSNFSMRANSVIYPIVERDGALYPASVHIGDDVYIGGFFQLHCIGNVAIGNGVVISEHVYISDVSHGLDPKKGPILSQPLESKGPVAIGDNTFIGYGASIMPGVNLGKNCIVGARSVVTRSFPDGSMIAGVPAKLIKKYNYTLGVWEGCEA